MAEDIDLSALFSQREIGSINNKAEELDKLRKELEEQYGTQNPESWSARIIATKKGGVMAEAKRIANAVRELQDSVTIFGESGTGKELLAHVLHGNRSVRSGDRFGTSFVPVNCAGFVETLFESTLFGHVKGAFTGAIRDNPGVLRAAENGTAFLDEIGELLPSQQAKLLRVIETGKILPVGASEEVEINCRFVFATNRPLRRMVSAGTFREDLYHRITRIKIHTAPLRDRPEDIQPIVKAYFKSKDWEMIDEVRDIPNWVIESKGNVRELHNYLFHVHTFNTIPIFDPNY